MRRPAWLVSSAGAAALVAVAVPAAAGDDSPPARSPGAAIRVEPRVVEVGMLYRGTTVRVEGTAPAGPGLVVECMGGDGRVQLKRKGKVWNLLWMNVDGVTFERVPSLYLAHADRDGVPSDPRSGLGWERVEARALPSQADEGTRRLFREFIKLKETERLYALGTLRREANQPSGGTLLAGLAGAVPPPARVVAELSLPASAPPGEYQVRMLRHRGAAPEILASDTLTIRRVGVAHLVASMAQGHGLLYGILSVAAALAAGLLSGFLFSGAKKGH